MPSFTERRQARFLNRTRLGAGKSSASSSYTQIAPDGYQTLSGCARVLKTIYLRPQDFNTDLPNASGVGASGLLGGCSTGSLFTGCVVFTFGASAFPGAAAASALTVPVLTMGLGSSPASPLWAVATFAVPTDADTTGSIIAYVDWTYGDAPGQTGCKKSFTAALGYIDGKDPAPVGVRTAASTGGASVASYAGTSCGLVQSTCLGKFPSFSACDSLGVFVGRLGASAAAQDGTIATGCVFILGYRLNYLAKSLGTQSTE